MTEKPKVTNSAAAKELDQAAKQFDQFDQSIKDLTQDRMNQAPKMETEPQTKLSTNQISDAKEYYVKPKTVVSCRDKFNEKYRDEYNYMKQYVAFIAEHSELKGENIEMWTKPYAGVPAEEWVIPTNKPIFAPRYVAEQIKSKFYHRIVMKDSTTSRGSEGSYYGQLAADTTIQRLDAIPVNKGRKSIFMGAE